MTLTKSRLGSQVALLMGQRIRQSSMFTIVPTDLVEVWRIFQQYDDKAWSFPDCALLSVAQENQILTVFSFDHHIDQMPNVSRAPVT